MCENGDAYEMDDRAQDVHPHAREHCCVGSVHGSVETPRGRIDTGRVVLEGFTSPRLAFCISTAGTVSHGCLLSLTLRSEFEWLKGNAAFRRQ